jgi:hypothetical protein
MATLSATELTGIRQECARTQVVDYPKAVINAAAQAIEDYLENMLQNRPATSLNAAINTATSPVTLSAAQKKKIGAEVLQRKFLRDK